MLEQDINSYGWWILLKLSSCVEWLSFHCPKEPEIQSKDIVEYVEERLDALLTTPVYQNLALRRKFGLVDQVRFQECHAQWGSTESGWRLPSPRKKNEKGDRMFLRRRILKRHSFFSRLQVSWLLRQKVTTKAISWLKVKNNIRTVNCHFIDTLA